MEFQIIDNGDDIEKRSNEGEVSKSLLERLCEDQKTLYILELMGLFVPFNADGSRTHSIYVSNRSVHWSSAVLMTLWYVSLRTCVFSELISPITDSIRMFGPSQAHNLFFSLVADMAYSFQLLCLWFSLYFLMMEKFGDSCTVKEFESFKKVSSTVLGFLLINAVIIIPWFGYSVSFTSKLLNRTENWFVYDEVTALASTTSCSFLLALNFWFVTYDCDRILVIINSMMEPAKNDTLSIEEYNEKRKHLRELIRKTEMCNLLVAVSAMTNLILCVVLLLSRYRLMVLFLLTCALRDNVYLTLVLFQGARVNERADKLTRVLASTTRFDRKLPPSIDRMAIAISCQNDPITYPFVFQRLTRKGVAVRLIIMTATTLLAVVRADFMDHV